MLEEIKKQVTLTAMYNKKQQKSYGINLDYYTENWNEDRFDTIVQIIENGTHFMGVFPTYEDEDGTLKIIDNNGLFLMISIFIIAIYNTTTDNDLKNELSNFVLKYDNSPIIQLSTKNTEILKDIFNDEISIDSPMTECYKFYLSYLNTNNNREIWNGIKRLTYLNLECDFKEEMYYVSSMTRFNEQ